MTLTLIGILLAVAMLYSVFRYRRARTAYRRRMASKPRFFSMYGRPYIEHRGVVYLRTAKGLVRLKGDA